MISRIPPGSIFANGFQESTPSVDLLTARTSGSRVRGWWLYAATKKDFEGEEEEDKVFSSTLSSAS